MLRQAQHHHERCSPCPFALSLSKGRQSFCFALLTLPLHCIGTFADHKLVIVRIETKQKCYALSGVGCALRTRCDGERCAVRTKPSCFSASHASFVHNALRFHRHARDAREQIDHFLLVSSIHSSTLRLSGVRRLAAAFGLSPYCKAGASSRTPNIGHNAKCFCESAYFKPCPSSIA